MRARVTVLRSGLVSTLLFVSAAASMLAGCNKFESRNESDAPLHPTLPAGATPYCSSYLTQDQIDTLAASVDKDAVSGVQGGDPHDCQTSAREKSVGYAQVVIVPTYKLGNSTSFAQSDANNPNSEWVAEIATTLDQVPPQTLSQVQGAVGPIAHGRSFPVVSGAPNFSAVAFGADLAQVPHEVLPNSLRFHVPASVAQAFGASLKDYDAGQAPLTFYSAANFPAGQLARGEAHSGEAVRLSQFTSQTASDYLNDLWTRIVNTHGAITDNTLPFLWMDQARAWWPSLKLQPEDAAKLWNAAWAQANELWSQPGDRTEQVGATSSLRALRFLIAVDPTNPASSYGAEMTKLATLLGNDDGVIYAAMMDLVHIHAKDPQAVLDLAGHLVPKTASPAEAWKAAVTLAGRVNGDSAKTKTVGEALDWIQQVRPADSASDEAVNWVANQGVDETRLTQLKGIYDFLSKNGFADQAWDKSVDLVVTKKLSSAQIDAYTKLVGAFVAAHRTDALAKADDDVIAKNMSPQQASAMASTIAWLTTVPGVTDPVAKAEDYLVAKNIAPDDVLRLQAIYKWLLTTSRNLQALSKAEDYVLVKKLNADQTSAIQLAYNWLAYTPQGAQSFDKAEDYVLNQHLTLDQVGQLQAVGQWLANTPVGANGAVAKAEDYVLTRKLTSTQTDLLSTVYIWLREAGVSADQLFAKSEDYVLNKHLTPEQFAHLRASYSTHKQAGDLNPLASAEKDTFGGGGWLGGLFH